MLETTACWRKKIVRDKNRSFYQLIACPRLIQWERVVNERSLLKV